MPPLIEVETGHNDVPHVERAVAQLLDLAQRRLLVVKLDAVGEHEEAAEALPGAIDVARPNPVSTNTKPARGVSINRRLQTSRRSRGSPSGPYIRRLPHGHMVLQLR